MALNAMSFHDFEDYERSTNEYVSSENSDGLFESRSSDSQSLSKYDSLCSDSSLKKSSSNQKKRFICYLETCRKEFSQFCSLQKHERIHKGDKPYVCKICTHAFTQLSNLKRHERLHTGEKPYVCQYCPKSFSNISNLKQHQQIHEDNTHRSKYVCNICVRSYYYQSSLKKHMKEHEGKVKVEEIDSPPYTEPEFDQKSEDELFSDTTRKIVKIEIGSDGNNKTSIEIDLQVNEEELSKLPGQYLEIINNIALMKEMQNIALKTGTGGNNPVEAFERIRQSLAHYFPQRNENSQEALLDDGLLLINPPNESADPNNYGDFVMEEDYDGLYSKERKGYNPSVMMNYLEDFDPSETFFRGERGL